MRRRALLLSLAALAGCAKYGDENPPAGAAGSPPAAGAGEVLVRADAVPVGGGTVLADRRIVVTQPAAGEFKAFSAVCTHQGCVVKDVSGGTINCPCHGSKFKVADASVAAGPAPRPLEPRPVTVKSGEVRLA
ncbi:Rieske (2Fe-2S) protein [Streptomyces sp. NPDC046977]|uniref:Rieske (2Fe-2S) protein n=1 Tax=Streptomyces sp. NPDC046977 TaxID=3154703 RepID=UPI0033C041AA